MADLGAAAEVPDNTPSVNPRALFDNAPLFMLTHRYFEVIGEPRALASLRGATKYSWSRKL
jgi:hypothetical protein